MHSAFYLSYTLLQLLVFIINFHRLRYKGWDLSYIIGVDSILAQHLTQLFLSLVRGERPQLFILALLSELYESRRWPSLHTITHKFFFSRVKKVTAINLLIANNFFVVLVKS